MTDQLALNVLDEPEPNPQPVRALDTCESEITDCRGCGGVPEWRLDGRIDLCDLCLTGRLVAAGRPLPYGVLPF